MSLASVSRMLHLFPLGLVADLFVPTGRAIDERKSIVGIPKLFTKMLHGGEDPLTAVKMVVALLAGEPAS